MMMMKMIQTVKMSSDRECVICFDTLLSNHTPPPLRCHIVTCNNIICQPCFADMMEYCQRENTYPKCSCDSDGEYTHIIPQDQLPTFQKLLHHHLTKENADDIQTTNHMMKMLRKIAYERMEYLKKEFPASIAKCAEIAFASKMRQSDRLHKKKMMDTDNSNARKCLSVMCVGYLKDDVGDNLKKCDLCDTSYCMLCEKIWRSDEHKCKSDDVETVKYLKNHVQCPKCHVHIEKSEGCDHMHCTNCQTNFYYSTGQEGGSGNRHNVDLTLKQDRHMHVMFADRLKGRQHSKEKRLLFLFEQYVPHIAKPYVPYLSSLSQDPSQKELEKLHHVYTKFVLHGHYRTLYFRIMRDIEDRYQNQDNALDILEFANTVFQLQKMKHEVFDL